MKQNRQVSSLDARSGSPKHMDCKGVVWNFIFNGQVNGESYLNFLENELPILFQDVPVDLRISM